LLLDWLLFSNFFFSLQILSWFGHGSNLSVAQNNIGTLEKQSEAEKKEISSLKQCVLEKEDSCSELSNLLAEAKSELLLSNQSLNICRNQFENQEKKLKLLQDDKLAKDLTVSKLACDLQISKDELVVVKTEKLRLSSDFNSEIGTMNSTISDLKGEIKILQSTITDQKIKIEHSDKRTTLLNQKFGSLQLTSNKMTEKLVAATSDIALKTTAIDELNGNLKELQLKYDQALIYLESKER
jgi:chromosome segregation ATPase